MSLTDDRTIEDVVIRQATQWQVRHGEGELNPDEKVQFTAWLRRSPQHVRCYLELTQFSVYLAQATAELPAEDLSEAGSATPARDNVLSLQVVNARQSAGTAMPQSSWRRPRIAATAGCVALAICGSIYWLVSPVPAEIYGQIRAEIGNTVAVPHGDQRTITLSDGSIVHLNSQSTVRMRYSQHERLIELKQGQALFNVAHDPSRPFRVRVQDTDVLALGTEFDVYRKPDGLTVTVVDGKVEVRAAAPIVSAGEPASGAVEQGLRLQAGQQLRLAPRIRMPKAETVDVRMATAWIRREILFDQQRLEDVAAEFNRYIPTPISLEDPLVRERRVSGIFNAYDAESFMAFLRQYDIDIEHTGQSIRVRSRKP